MDAARRPLLSPPLFYGFAVASIGGPLALAVIYVPGAADMRSAGLVTVVGAFLYAAPLSVWLRFSRDVVSPAGLAGFVEAAAGRRLAGGSRTIRRALPVAGLIVAEYLAVSRLPSRSRASRSAVCSGGSPCRSSRWAR
jgi:hypothetical protein